MIDNFMYHSVLGIEIAIAWYIASICLYVSIRRRHNKDMYGIEKRAAYKAVRIAIANGTLVRAKACSHCGRVPRESTHAHHWHGYSPLFRLDVVWLCASCHQSVHRGQIDLVMP